MKGTKFVPLPLPSIPLPLNPQGLPYPRQSLTGAARTCGEGIEAGWADTNPAALSTRKMSLTYRHEVLDDLFGAINWRKIKTMGEIECLRSFIPLIVFSRHSTRTKFTSSDTHGAQTHKAISADERDGPKVGSNFMGTPNPYLGQVRI
jgi:hypothetical protein